MGSAVVAELSSHCGEGLDLHGTSGDVQEESIGLVSLITGEQSIVDSPHETSGQFEVEPVEGATCLAEPSCVDLLSSFRPALGFPQIQLRAPTGGIRDEGEEGPDGWLASQLDDLAETPRLTQLDDPADELFGSVFGVGTSSGDLISELRIEIVVLPFKESLGVVEPELVKHLLDDRAFHLDKSS